MNESPRRPNVSIVVAVTTKNAAIGNGGNLLVRISDDLKRFKDITTGHAVITGRKTHESIGRLLPGRQNFIVTRDPKLEIPGAVVCHSLDEALEKAWAHELANTAISADKKEIFLIGGGEIYRQGLPFVHKIYLTLIESDLQGDVFFPEYKEFTRETFRESHIDEKTGLKYTWVDLER
jgi:dihydrofolate reductase